MTTDRADGLKLIVTDDEHSENCENGDEASYAWPVTSAMAVFGKALQGIKDNVTVLEEVTSVKKQNNQAWPISDSNSQAELRSKIMNYKVDETPQERLDRLTQRTGWYE